MSATTFAIWNTPLPAVVFGPVNANGSFTEGFRTAALCRRGGFNGAGVRKPRKGETAGRKGRGLVGRGATYGDFGFADEALVGLRGRWLIVKGDPRDQAGQHFLR